MSLLETWTTLFSALSQQKTTFVWMASHWTQQSLQLFQQNIALFLLLFSGKHFLDSCKSSLAHSLNLAWNKGINAIKTTIHWSVASKLSAKQRCLVNKLHQSNQTSNKLLTLPYFNFMKINTQVLPHIK